MKPYYNTFLTNNSSNIKKNKSKNYSQNNSNRKSNNFEEKREITIEEMTNFFLDKDSDKTKQKKININSAVNHKKNSQQKKRIKMSVNDPLNPYSALFYNGILFNNYKVKMHYKKMEQGVPYLRTRKVKRGDLPPLTQGNNVIEERNFPKTYSSGIKKKKIVLLPNTDKNKKNISKNNSDENKAIKSENIDNNYNNNENKDIKNENNENKDEKKDIEAKMLFQTYEDNNDFVNEEYEFKKEDADINDHNEMQNENKDNKRLSGIIEEDN